MELAICFKASTGTPPRSAGEYAEAVRRTGRKALSCQGHSRYLTKGRRGSKLSRQFFRFS